MFLLGSSTHVDKKIITSQVLSERPRYDDMWRRNNKRTDYKCARHVREQWRNAILPTPCASCAVFSYSFLYCKMNRDITPCGELFKHGPVAHNALEFSSALRTHQYNQQEIKLWCGDSTPQWPIFRQLEMQCRPIAVQCQPPELVTNENQRKKASRCTQTALPFIEVFSKLAKWMPFYFEKTLATRHWEEMSCDGSSLGKNKRRKSCHKEQNSKLRQREQRTSLQVSFSLSHHNIPWKLRKRHFGACLNLVAKTHKKER